MPLSTPAPRGDAHHRTIDMKAYAREDGLFDVEAHLVDRKPFEFLRRGNPVPVPAGDAIHDLWVRMTVDQNFTVRAIEAASDVTPHRVCKEAEATLQVMVGERIASGWSSKVKERLRGARSCTHLMEILIPLATTAFQGITGMDPKRPLAMDDKTAAAKIDSCYAYGRHSELVMRLWPRHYQPQQTD
jgi:Protein of unknown function (DUF2889)